MSTPSPLIGLNIIPFDQDPWDEDFNENVSILDSLLGQYIAISNMQGIWKNAHAYLVGQHVVDPVDGSLWICNVGHTSATLPTLFSADRVAHPSFWTQTGASAATSASAAATSAAAAAASAASTGVGQGFLGGLGLVYNSATLLDVRAGMCVDSTNTTTIIVGAITKNISGAWVAGSNQNGMGVGLTATLNTWYNVFAATVGGAGDVFFDTSGTAANKPVGTTAFRHIGWMKLDASVHIVPFDQYDDRVDLRTRVSEYSGTPGVTTAVTLTLTGAPPNSQALLTGVCSDATPASGVLYLSSLVQADVAATNPNVTCQWAATAGNVATFAANVVTNSSGQIRRRVSTTTATINVIATGGWIDTRGRG